MKKVTKKHLIIMVVVAVLATVMAFCVSAADDNLGIYNCPVCEVKVDATYGEVVEAQCESYGYTPVICPICKYEFKEAKIVAALGHSVIEKEYVLDETGAYYQKNLRCAISGCSYGLKETIVELRSGAEVKYCKVSFTNDFVAAKFEDDGFCSYTTLVKSDDPETIDVDESIGAYKSNTEELFIEYPAKDASVVVTPKEKPIRLADRVFGEYTFKGWLTKEEISQIYAESNLQPIDLSYDANEIFKNDISYDQVNKQFVYPTVYKGQDYFDALSRAAQEKTSLEKAAVVITADTPADYSLYAIFNAETTLRHKVTFHKYNGEPIKTYEVPHGATVTFDKDTPKKPSNAEYNFEFACWVIFETETEVSNGHKVYPVYDSIHVEPYFDYTIRQYTFKYYKTGGKEAYKIGNIAVEDVVNIAGKDYERLYPVNGLLLNERIESYFDEEYFYEPTGLWKIPSRNNHLVDLNNVTLPGGINGMGEGVKSIVLEPEYQPIKRSYKLTVDIIYIKESSKDYYPDDITITILNAQGKIVGSAKRNIAAENKNNVAYRATFDVFYSPYLTVRVESDGYSDSKTAEFLVGLNEKYEDDRYQNVLIELRKNTEEPCNCICHGVFKPVWVGILNILNALFKLQFVCCDDMYANIGGDLNYGV